MEKSFRVLARRYRPKTFEEMVGQKAVVQTLRNAVQTKRIAQAYLFSGMRGVGKTTAARILAKALNCQNGPTPTPCNSCEFCTAINEDRLIDVMEIDGASNRGVEEIGQIRDSAKYKPIHSRYKVIIIDEVHMLTTHAFNALLKTLEEPPENTIFIFATTEFHKVPATIVSRCQHFEFRKISQKDIIRHLMDIAEKEKVTVSASGLKLIAEAADGSLRDAQSLLDQAVAFSGEIISDDDLKEILGAMSQEIMFQCSAIILDQHPEQVFSLIDNILGRGYDLKFFLKELIFHFRNILLVKSVENADDLLAATSEEMARLKAEAVKVSTEELLRYLTALQQAEQGLRYSSDPQIFLESVLIRLCHYKKMTSLKELLKEMEFSEPASSLEPKIQNQPSVSGTPSVFPAAQKPGPSGKEGPLESGFAPSVQKTAPVASSPPQVPEKRISVTQNRPGSTAAPPAEERGVRRDKETDSALKDPSVREFMETFKAQVLSVGPARKKQNADSTDEKSGLIPGGRS